MAKIIGLTGGIGSGKTLVAKYIESLGIPVYIADDAAKEIMESDEVVREIAVAFGKEIAPKGVLNREKLAKLVFNNPDQLKRLNSMVHPKVKEHFDSWAKKNWDNAILVKEAAILFESGSYKDCDVVISVTAPLETRIERVISRDKSDREAVLKRMDSQWTDEQRVAKSDFIIHNISVKETYKQTEQILNLLINQ